MITHPEKVLFPGDGITKGELADYYEHVAPVMLPHIAGRPVTMERYPGGIDAKGFMHKSVVRGFPEWLERVEVPKKGGTVQHPLVRDTRALLWMANQNCITPHVWVTRVPRLDEPDICLFDLDPPGDDEGALRDAALALRDFLHELGLATVVKTSGSKGFHIAILLGAGETLRDVSRFAHVAGAELVRRQPERFTQEFSKVDRKGRIYLDTGRNHPPATYAAPYAVRARTGAPVSAPCTWDEVASGAVTPRTFTLRNMRERLAAVGDLWAAVPPVSLAGAIVRLRELRA